MITHDPEEYEIGVKLGVQRRIYFAVSVTKKRETQGTSDVTKITITCTLLKRHTISKKIRSKIVTDTYVYFYICVCISKLIYIYIYIYIYVKYKCCKECHQLNG
jgi:hypothetical protein